MIEFIRKVMVLAAPYRTRLVLGVLFGLLAGALEPLAILVVVQAGTIVFPASVGADGGELLQLPASLRPWTEALASRFGGSPSDGLKLLAIAAIPLVFLLRGLFTYLNAYFLQWVGIRTVSGLRTRLFSHLQGLSPGFFSHSRTGDLMSRIISDTLALQDVITASVAIVVKDPVTLVMLVGMLLVFNAKLTLLTVLIFPLCLVPTIIFSRKVRRSSEAIQNSFADLANAMHEAFTGNRIIKAYNLEDDMIQRFTHISRRFVGQYMRVIRSQEIPGPLIEFIGSIGVAGLFVFFALQPNPAPDKLVIFAANLLMMYRPLKNLTRLHSQLEKARAASARIFELLETQNSVAEPLQPRPLRAAGAPICFERVGFSYADKEAVQEVSFTIQPGEMIALVGPSGSGKTTLCNLALRFYDPQHGRILIGGVDIRDVATRDLRNQIAVVSQDVILFNDTIRKNIELGRPGASAQEIEAAATHAFAHAFILEKPLGYDTVIGEKGALLSGGQRQRIAIARAILKAAPILILDEATSALDTESERAVQAALDGLMRGRTTLCVAHRLSTIQNATRILVLDHGRIVEQGPHAELIRRQGAYRRLHDLQFAP